MPKTLPKRPRPAEVGTSAGEGRSLPGDDGAAPAWSLPWSLVAERLGVDVTRGLGADEVRRRRRRFGPNRLRRREKRPAWRILADQFKSLIVLLLLAAAAVSFLFGETIEGFAIVVVILINAVLGFATELRAVRSMEALYALGVVHTRVRRDGVVAAVPAEDLVPGDVVLVEGGDVITADLRLVESSKLEADESVLTGESLPVPKDVAPVAPEAPLAERSCMLFKGTAVTRGSATALVTATGMATELGQISALVAEAEEEATPLEKRLNRLGGRLIHVTLALTAAIAVAGMWAGKDAFLMIETAIALAVATIPEGLPIVATIALARGMRLMAKKHALVNRLSAVETLGATHVICTDKTGTLTENRMTVARLVLDDGEVVAAETFRKDGAPVEPETHRGLRAALEVMALCNNATLRDGREEGATGDPLEVALLAAAARAALDRERLIRSFPERREEAFDPERKLMATFHETAEGFRVAVKGAPEAVLAASTRAWTEHGIRPLDDAGRAAWMRRNEALAAEGFRVLAVAEKTVARPEADPYETLTFLALVALHDPPRSDARPAVEACRAAGIRVVMVTGDQPVTALAVARAVGIVGEDADVIHGAEVPDLTALPEDERRRVLEAPIFARVTPKQKLDLIELHQRAGRIVAMTGDGVNDAPALKKADIGVAMGKRGTQVAREAADMVLEDDSFSTIVAAVEQGRIIFGNIRRFVFYLMSCNVSEVMVVGLASVAGAPLPVLPLQILFLNLVTDIFPALALGVGSGPADVMRRPPRRADEPVLGRRHWFGIAAYGGMITASVLGSLFLARAALSMPVGAAVTVSFLTLALAQLWHVFNMRGRREGLWVNEVTRNPYVWAALALCAGLILAAVYVPGLAGVLRIEAPDGRAWLLILTMSGLPAAVGAVWNGWRRRAGGS
ncbi:cation-translocating P-type ATPase [Rhodocaloribacter sp.]